MINVKLLPHNELISCNMENEQKHLLEDSTIPI